MSKESSLGAVGEAGEMMRLLDDQTLEVNLPSRIGYERIAMECSASFAKSSGFFRNASKT